MNVYFLSGLGADKRVFAKLIFSSQFSINHIEWILPAQNEELADYAKRLLSQIDTSRPFILVGLSFGGILAIEISKLVQPEQIILLSSISCRQQIPWYYKLAGKLKIPQLVPAAFLKFPNPLSNWFFGANTQEQKGLLRQILIDTDKSFLKWAISKIPSWDNEIRPKNVFHIHGAADRVIPIKFIQADIKIQGGGHLMVFEQYEMISKIMADKMKPLSTI